MTDPGTPVGGSALPPPPPPLPPEAQTTGGPVPHSADEALEIGRNHFPPVGSPGGPTGLFVHEFDEGYLIHAGWPLPEDPSAPPAQPGGSNVVIAKEDGEVTFLPNFPPPEAVKLYHRLRANRPG
ncbi:hypothetical protein [Streptomyces benahoarensis]|uniref:Uncharacterized protein n=1 Tax=Streptomyces benahoarensis TaxID=2595054 RepID=A0A553XZ35_9ACTN|nr:hypothetical protein [Streptomyces benahoarensis]TSB15687.1 hypothetical protein FNJ62_28620 [Streptomyces benahoarensis]TSB22245.1 hypothetical protein FNZ23_27865 [Streptomyces benahoarensis]